MAAASTKRKRSTPAAKDGDGKEAQQQPSAAVAVKQQQELIELVPPAEQQPGPKKRRVAEQLEQQPQEQQREESPGAAEVGTENGENGANLQSEDWLESEEGAQGVHSGSGPGTEDMTEDGQVDGSSPGSTRGKKVLSEAKLKRLKEEHDRRGVLYVSRIPPHMKPQKLKQLLSQYGETLRVYCTPEDPKARKLRKRSGGNTGKNFTEGWVEFADKRIAKRVALMLNGRNIGGRRRSAYFDDLWCIKYLKHFKWDHLTEEIAYQKAVREQRLAAEISAAKRERDHFLAQVDKAKGLAAMAERRAAKAGAGGTEGEAGQPAGKQRAEAAPAGAGAAAAAAAPAVRMVNRDIGQRAPRADPAGGGATGRELADDVLMMVARREQSHASS